VAKQISGVDKWIVAMGDNPLLPAGVVTMVANQLSKRASAAMGRAVITSDEERRDETTQKMVVTFDDYLIYISRCPIPWTRQSSGRFYKAVNVFAIWADVLEEYATWPTADCEAREGLEILRLLDRGHRVQTIEVRSVKQGVVRRRVGRCRTN